MIDRVDTDAWKVNDGHREAAARCLHLIERRHGCGVICGESGCGKTLVLRRMLRRAARLTHRVCYLDLNSIDAAEFQWRLCAGLRLAPSANEGRTSLWTRITDALDGGEPGQVSAAVLIDHADAAHSDVLPELRRWLQLAHDQRRTVSIIASRTPIPQPLVNILADFCDLRADVHPMTAEQAAEFIRNFHEIESLGTAINSETADTLHRLSQGRARKLERLCRLAKLANAAEDGAPLDRAALEALANELGSLPRS